MSRSSAAIAIILAAVAGFFVGNITATRDGAEPSDVSTGAAEGTVGGDGQAQEDVFRVPVGNSPTRGPRDALVTIVEFSEFQ